MLGGWVGVQSIYRSYDRTKMRGKKVQLLGTTIHWGRGGGSGLKYRNRGNANFQSYEDSHGFYIFKFIPIKSFSDVILTPLQNYARHEVQFYPALLDPFLIARLINDGGGGWGWGGS